MHKTPFPIVLSYSCPPILGIKKLLDSAFLRAGVKNNESNFLAYTDGNLTLYSDVKGERLSASIDFVKGKSMHRRQYGGGKNQPMAKACGLDKHPKWKILDATAGLGKDAFVLASLGAQITLCEQHVALYSLLVDAIHRASQVEEVADIVKRMTCMQGNSIEYLDRGDMDADVIYLDPMYPHRKKSAKIKKEMQVLQQLVGHEGNAEKLLNTALKTAKNRVVVKRPKQAGPLNDLTPSYKVSSANTRYDVYVM